MSRFVLTAVIVTALLLPDLAFAQNVDPTATVTNILTWLSGPFGKVAIAVVIGITAFACMLGHHPYAALGSVVLGAFLLFGSNFFVTNFIGG